MEWEAWADAVGKASACVAPVRACDTAKTSRESEMSVPANSFISAPSVGSCFACALHPSWAQQRLDRAALIHCAVGLRYLDERQVHIADLAGVTHPITHLLHQLT